MIPLTRAAELLHADLPTTERWARRGLLGETQRRLVDGQFVTLVALESVVAFAPEAAKRLPAYAPIAEREAS